MPVNRRGDSWQAAFAHKGQRYRATFDSKKEAERWEEQAKDDVMAGREVAVPLRKASPKVAKAEPGAAVPTLGEFVQTVYRSRWMDLKAPATALTNANQVAKALGKERLVSTLSKADALKVKEYFRAEGVTSTTINRKLAALSTLAKEAREYGYLTTDFKVGLTKENSGRIRVVSYEEERIMLDWCQRWRFQDLYDYIVVSIATGFRQGEVLKIEVRDVSEANVWTFDSKNGRNREVPVADARVKEVFARRKAGKGPRDRLFPIPKKRIEAHWTKLCQGIGVKREEDKEFVPHCMRHTFCTRLFEHGADAKTVMELAGHSSIVTTQRYAHSSPERKRLAILKLPTIGTGTPSSTAAE